MRKGEARKSLEDFLPYFDLMSREVPPSTEINRNKHSLLTNRFSEIMIEK